jgi:hypothetical protein
MASWQHTKNTYLRCISNTKPFDGHHTPVQKCISEDVNELYLVDGEHLPIALLHLLELPQEVPAQK